MAWLRFYFFFQSRGFQYNMKFWHQHLTDIYIRSTEFSVIIMQTMSHLGIIFTAIVTEDFGKHYVNLILETARNVFKKCLFFVILFPLERFLNIVCCLLFIFIQNLNLHFDIFTHHMSTCDRLFHTESVCNEINAVKTRCH